MAKYFDDQSAKRISSAVRKIEKLVGNGTDARTPGRPVYNGGSIPAGEFQYTPFQTVSQNQSGYDFLRAHPLVG